MMQFSLLDRRPEQTCLDLLQKNGIGMLARGTVAQGLLVDKPAKEYLVYSTEEVARAAAAIHSLSGPERSSTQIALQFVLQNPAVTAAIVGTGKTKQLSEAVAESSKKLLTGAEMELLRQLLPVNHYDLHR